MPRIRYRDVRFTEEKLAVIATVNRICAEYARQGYDLTLRQLYYQFVARGYLANSLQKYKWLGGVVNDGRMAGLIDWNYITDRTRNLRGLRHWDDPASMVKDFTEDFRVDAWKNQPTRVEVWIEKDALLGLIGRVCNNNDLPFFSCRGYTSQSEAWGAAQRIGEFLRGGQNVLLLHLGDHDPSGVDMSRDIRDRLELFIEVDNFNHLERLASGKAKERPHLDSGVLADAVAETSRHYGRLEVRRVALTMAQVREFDPPPNPAKMSDSRAKGYVERHGYSSWELDALSPDVLASIVQRHVDSVRLKEPWIADMHVIQQGKRTLKRITERWAEVEAMANGPDRV